jgi:hypothetical protein
MRLPLSVRILTNAVAQLPLPITPILDSSEFMVQKNISFVWKQKYSLAIFAIYIPHLLYTRITTGDFWYCFIVFTAMLLFIIGSIYSVLGVFTSSLSAFNWSD